MKKGIDISKWQRKIDFEKVKKNVDFIIIKCGGSDSGFYKDKFFDYNYEMCKKYKIPTGCYYFVGKNFISTNDGTRDAKRFFELIKDKQFEYPIVLDIETTSPKNKTGATNATIAFCKYMESKGYYISIYASDIYGFKERLEINRLKEFDKWVASYSKTPPTYVKEYGMWQYSSKGIINGINGNVDLNYSYKNYPSIMKKNKLNGF